MKTIRNRDWVVASSISICDLHKHEKLEYSVENGWFPLKQFVFCLNGWMRDLEIQSASEKGGFGLLMFPDWTSLNVGPTRFPIPRPYRYDGVRERRRFSVPEERPGQVKGTSQGGLTRWLKQVTTQFESQFIGGSDDSVRCVRSWDDKGTLKNMLSASETHQWEALNFLIHLIPISNSKPESTLACIIWGVNRKCDALHCTGEFTTRPEAWDIDIKFRKRGWSYRLFILQIVHAGIIWQDLERILEIRYPQGWKNSEG